MEIPADKIAQAIEKVLKSEVKKLKKPLKLVTILVGEAPEQLSFVAIKKKVARRLGIRFEFIHILKEPSFQDFIKMVKSKSQEAETTGMIIQQPLPAHLDTNSVYDFIDSKKEIEGHQKKPLFAPPLGLAVLTALKYALGQSKLNKSAIVDIHADKNLFKKSLRNDKVVMVGRGITGGKPIGRTLSYFGINYINIHSGTPTPEEYYRDADIIITAVGRRVLGASSIKPGTILINAGLRRENGKLRGDYDEREVENIARFYTKTPGGVGPLDVLYLYKNLIDAAKLQG